VSVTGWVSEVTGEVGEEVDGAVGWLMVSVLGAVVVVVVGEGAVDVPPLEGLVEGITPETWMLPDPEGWAAEDDGPE
jgi:hypothetical protein